MISGIEYRFKYFLGRLGFRVKDGFINVGIRKGYSYKDTIGLGLYFGLSRMGVRTNTSFSKEKNHEYGMALGQVFEPNSINDIHYKAVRNNVLYTRDENIVVFLNFLVLVGPYTFDEWSEYVLSINTKTLNIIISNLLGVAIEEVLDPIIIKNLERLVLTGQLKPVSVEEFDEHRAKNSPTLLIRFNGEIHKEVRNDKSI